MTGIFRRCSGLLLALVFVCNATLSAQSTATFHGEGAFLIAALTAGPYGVEIRASEFRTHVVKHLVIEVAGTAVRDFAPSAGAVDERVLVRAEALMERGTIWVGQVIGRQTIQEIPLNGRHVVDLGLLVAGSVTQPQNGVLTAPQRGQGASGFNTAGRREDAVNFMINGINLNDSLGGIVTVQPSRVPTGDSGSARQVQLALRVQL